MSDTSGSYYIRALEQTLGLLDTVLQQANTSVSDMAGRLTLNVGAVDEDGLRPKSFLHDEMDEFNQIFEELARPRRAQLGLLPYELDDSTASSTDSSSTPVDWLAQPSQGAASCTTETASSLYDDLASPLISDCELERLFIREDDERVFPTTDVENPASGLHGMRRSSSCAESCTAPLVDTDLRLYSSLTGGLKLAVHKSDRLGNLKRGDLQLAGNTRAVSSHETTSATAAGECLREDDVDSGYQSGNNTMVTMSGISIPAEPGVLCANDLQRRIHCFNTNNMYGLKMSTAADTGIFQGCIRVHMNLHKPVHMPLTSRPSSVYDLLTNSSSEASCTGSAETDLFYLPSNTVKVIHITSEMKTADIIQTLLHKFMITDQCSKFALYEKLTTNGALVEKHLNGMMRRLNDDERPLELCLRWSDEGVDSLDKHQFVLQDNVTGEIMWDAFSLPELEAFLRILEREEDSYVGQIRLKYSARKLAVEKRLKELEGKKKKVPTATLR